MRIVILRGGSPRLRRPGKRPAGSQSHSTRERGVMAIGDGSGRWILVNMSPSVAHQLDSDARLDLHAGLPAPDVRAVVLTDAQVDHVGGLLSLRDGAPIDLYATPAVFEELTTAMPVLPVLQHYCGVHWHVVPVAGDRPVAGFRVEGMPTLEFTALATQAPPPPHLAHAEHGRVGDSIALAVRDTATGQRVFCAPGLAQIGADEFAWMREADCLLMDSPASAEPDDGNGTSLPPWFDLLGTLPARHKVLFGEPPAAPASGELDRHGIEVAYDGMEIAL